MAPLPSVKKSRGRPRKSDQSADSELTKAPSTEKKKRGRPKKEPAKAEEAMSPLTSIATSLISLRNGGADLKVAAEPAVITAASSDDSEAVQDWQCPCGLWIAARKVRCGTCRKWKGGKRDKKWTFKSNKDAEEKAAKIAEKKDAKKRRRPRAARIMYAKLTQADLGLKSDDESGTDGETCIRPEVESVLDQMLTAVSEAAGKKKRKRMPDSSKPGPSKKSVDRKVSVVTVEADANSDDKSNSEPVAKEQSSSVPFAFESLCHIVNMHIEGNH